MKYANYLSFEKHLESAAQSHFSEVYLIISKDDFIRGQAVKSLKKLYLKDIKSQDFSLFSFNAENENIEVLLKELNSFSMFAKKRLIIASNVDALEKEATLKIESYLASPSRSICFVAIASQVNRATTFYKKMEKAGVVLDVAEEKPWEKEKSVVDWVCSEALKNGKKLSLQCAQILVKQLGIDQNLLTQELHKLICYVGDKPQITDNDIASICSFVNLENGWQLGDAIFSRNAFHALRVSKSLLEEGTALIALLRQIRSQFQTKFQICSMLNSGGTLGDVGAEFPYMKGTILEKNVRQAEEYGMHRFKEGLLAIDQTELEAKNSSIDPDFAIERLVIKLTS